MILHPPSSPVSLTAPLGSFTGSFSSSLMAFSKGRDFPTWVNVIRELASRPSSDKPAQGLSKVNRTQLESLAWCSRPPGPVAPCVSLPNPQPPSQPLCPSPLSDYPTTAPSFDQHASHPSCLSPARPHPDLAHLLLHPKAFPTCPNVKGSFSPQISMESTLCTIHWCLHDIPLDYLILFCFS